MNLFLQLVLLITTTLSLSLGFHVPDNSKGISDYLADPLPIFPPVSCSNGFKPIGDSCYALVTRERTLAESRAYCQQFGGDLAKLETRSEIELIARYLDDINPNCEGVEGTLIWTSGTGGTDGGFVWDPEDDSSTVEFTNWDLGVIFPNDTTGTGIAMDCTSFSGYTWFPEPEDDLHSALCEIDPSYTDDPTNLGPVLPQTFERTPVVRSAPDRFLTLNIEPKLDCGRSEIAIGDQCYLFFKDVRSTYTNAETICRNFEGGHLLYLETRTELALMTRYLNREFPSCFGFDVPAAPYRFLWTGGRSLSRPTESFKWGNTNVGYSLWDEPNPDLNGGFIGLVLTCDSEYYWTDAVTTGGTAVPFICEILS